MAFAGSALRAPNGSSSGARALPWHKVLFRPLGPTPTLRVCHSTLLWRPPPELSASLSIEAKHSVFSHSKTVFVVLSEGNLHPLKLQQRQSLSPSFCSLDNQLSGAETLPTLRPGLASTLPRRVSTRVAPRSANFVSPAKATSPAPSSEESVTSGKSTGQHQASASGSLKPPLLLFGADGSLQLSARPETGGPESEVQEAAAKKKTATQRNAAKPRTAPKAKVIPSVPAPEEEVSWKQGTSGRARKATPRVQATPKYSKAARRFYNEHFREAERLSKVLACAGIASRRSCEDIIFAGRVTVNGTVCTVPQTPVDLLKDNIYVDGRSLSKKLPPKLYFVVNKPKGYICSTVSSSGRTAISLVDEYMGIWKHRNPGVPSPRLFTVGRLDVSTTGLLLITNDGAFAQRVSHPSSGITKEYIATVSEKVTRRQLAKLEQGVEVDGVLCVPVHVERLGEASSKGDQRERVRLVVAEGRNREVRRIVEGVGLSVLNLKRVRIGALRLPKDLGIGKYKVLDEKDAEKILKEEK